NISSYGSWFNMYICGLDARVRLPGGPVYQTPAGEETSGTGTPGVRYEHPDTLPPDEEGVEDAEAHDDTR
ncbi:hypothetical protein, partial [Actinomadura sp. NPDC049753]|uniref:hypothetical protein n=1 Tax=Actinomadura sp. NPDC049753 TaxID=3154739 RepID=UPI00342ACE4D